MFKLFVFFAFLIASTYSFGQNCNGTPYCSQVGAYGYNLDILLGTMRSAAYDLNRSFKNNDQVLCYNLSASGALKQNTRYCIWVDGMPAGNRITGGRIAYLLDKLNTKCNVCGQQPLNWEANDSNGGVIFVDAIKN